MKYIDKLDWTKVNEIMDNMYITKKGILAFTSTNVGTLEKPAYNAHILERGNKITDYGIIDAERLVSIARTMDRTIPYIFAIKEDSRGIEATNQMVIDNQIFFLRGDRVRCILSTYLPYSVQKIENLV